MEKKAHQVATFFLHFHMLDLLWKWGTCISFPSILFFIGSRKYWLVLLSAVSSQFSFGLLGRFPILSLLHVLLVKTGSKVYCGHKRETHSLMNQTLPVMSTTMLQKPALLYNWYGSCITRTMYASLKTMLLRSRTGHSSYLSSAWDEIKRNLLLPSLTHSLTLSCDAKEETGGHSAHTKNATALTALVMCPNDLWIVHL